MDFFDEKENAEDQENDENASDFMRTYPVAPPPTIEFNERIGGLANAPAMMSVQRNSNGNILLCVKVGKSDDC